AFPKLVSSIKDVTLSQETLNVLKEHLNDLLVYLEFSSFYIWFVNTYE
ncbi:1674_t:CDS:1, partial [Dentiscutata heterogama]